MTRKLLFIFLLISPLLFSQGVSVSTTTYSPQQLLSGVVLNSACGTFDNVELLGAGCGIGYFNANGSSFPFSEGMILRSGPVPYTSVPMNTSTMGGQCSQMSDPDLQAIVMAAGLSGQVMDATFIQFDFVPTGNIMSFNYIFASNEYGTYQCQYADVFAFFLTDVSTGVTSNIALVPGTNVPVSVVTVRDNQYNTGCPSVNEQFFGLYNIDNPAPSLNMAGQTVPMTAMAAVVPGNTYRLKIAVADYLDSAFDSAIFIEGGSFSAGQCGANIQAVAFIDSNGNGVKDSNEYAFTQGSFSYQVNDTGDIINSYSPTGSLIIFPENETDTYDLDFVINPEFAAYFSTPSGFSNVTASATAGPHYFPVTILQEYNDVSISLVPLTPPVPGMDFTSKIAYTNQGYTPVSGSVTFTKDPVTTIENISQSGTTALPSGFSYSFTGLLPGETRHMVVTMSVPALPLVSLGDLVTSNATISIAATDLHPANNEASLTQEIVGSYDPNDKMEAHGPEILASQFSTDDVLRYTIRFQNTGTASAMNISITDLLDAQLDPSSVRMVTASHNYIMHRVGNQLTWNFDNIYLPGMLQNEPESHGYIVFDVKPLGGVEPGDVIPNSAEIYFDTNPAIVTNVFQTTFVNALSTPGHLLASSTIAPNPVRDVLQVSSAVQIDSARIVDLAGKVVYTANPKLKIFQIDTSGFESGVYFLELGSGEGRSVRKLIKQ